MNRYLVAALLLLVQTSAVFAVNGPKRTVRGRRNNVASGQKMRGMQGGEHMLAAYEMPIKNADVEGFNAALAQYKGGELGLWALLGKLSEAGEENHADESIESGAKGTKTKHLHEMRDAVREKMKQHKASDSSPAKERTEKKQRGQMKQRDQKQRGTANKKATTGAKKRVAGAKKAAAARTAEGATSVTK